MAKPDKVSISGLVIACSRTIAFDRRSIAAMAPSIRSLIWPSSAKTLITRMPRAVSCITFMISPIRAISFATISRTRLRISRRPTSAIGPTTSEASDRSGCW